MDAVPFESAPPAVQEHPELASNLPVERLSSDIKIPLPRIYLGTNGIYIYTVCKKFAFLHLSRLLIALLDKERNKTFLKVKVNCYSFNLK